MGQHKHHKTVEILMQQGLIIEAGWVGFRISCFSPDAPPEQIIDMRIAFFAGAQHLFSSLMIGLDEDKEPTEEDMKKMDKIHKELDRFLQEFRLKHGITEGEA